MVTLRRPSSTVVALLLVASALVPKGTPIKGTPEHTAAARYGLQVCDPTDPNSVFAVSVTPKGTAVSWPAQSAGHTSAFTVQNTGNCQDTYSFSGSGSGTVSSPTLDRTSQVLAPNQSTTVNATYSVGNMGSGQVTVNAVGAVGAASDAGWYSVSATIPPGAPTVDASPYNFAKQDYGQCAYACFAAMTTRATVPYFSLDAPRQVVLVYNGDRVNPRPFVLLNVSPDLNYGTFPSRYELQVKVDGAVQNFVNGEQTLRFAYTGTTPVRIGGQFDASGYTQPGVHTMDILVSAVFPAGSLTNDVNTKLVVVNQTLSPIARGWSVSSVQRLYPQTDTSALVVEGDGSAVYFARSSGSFVTPAGDFSNLIPSALSGSNGWARVYPDSTKVVFNSAGLMTRVLDRFGNRDSVVYDASNRVVQLIDPWFLRITLNYGANGLATIVESSGLTGLRTTSVTVDASNRLTALTDPDNLSTGFGYDASLRLSTITGRRGAIMTLGYDAQSGQLGSLTAPAVPIYGRGVMSPVTTYSPWQKVGVPYGPTGTPFTPPRADTVFGRTTEPGGAVTRFTVNSFGEPLLTLKPLGDTVSVTYTVNGQPMIVKQPGYGTAEVDTTLYLGNGLPYYVRPAGLSGTTIRYAGYGQSDSSWGPGQRGVRRFIGVNGRVDSVRVGGVVVQRLFYNTLGQVDSVKDGNNARIVKNTRGGTNGNLSQVVFPGGRTVSYTYDSLGRPTSIARSGRGTETRYYSSINRTDSIANGVDSLRTKFGYDPLFLTSVTDPKRQVYSFTFNALGWRTGHTDPASGTDSLAYSVDGELVHRVNRRGQVINLTYDSLHRTTGAVGGLSLSWTYGNHGRIVTASGGGVSTETMYLNAYGTPDSVKTIMASQTYWQRHLYTSAGQLDSTNVSGAGIAFLGRKYLYDAGRGVLTKIRLNGSATSFDFDNNFEVLNTSFPGGDLESRSYTTLHRMMRVTANTAYNSATERDVGFDAANGASEQDFAGTPTTGELYNYDSLGRVAMRRTGYYSTSTWCADPDYGLCRTRTDWITQTADTFAYDPAGNRTDRAGTYTTGNRVTQFNGCSYTTDVDGNVTSRTGAGCTQGTGTLTWHPEGLLATVTTGAATITLNYDALGRVVRKDVNGVPQSSFLWSGSSLLAELDGNGTVKRAEYSYYPGIDRLHALIIGSVIYYAHSDVIGNVIALTDSAQHIKRTFAFDMWGTLVSGADSLPFNGYDRARWKGALLLIPELNVSYMRHRWYEGGTGRFLSEDPLGGARNRYVYSGDDPINKTDPSGLLLQNPGDPIDVLEAVAGSTSFLDNLPIVFAEITKPADLECLGSADCEVDPAFLRAVYRAVTGHKPYWKGTISPWDPSAPPPELAPVVVPVGNKEQFDPGLWVLDKLEAKETSKVTFFADLPGVNLGNMGLSPAAKYSGYFLSTYGYATATGITFRFSAVGYVFTNGVAIYSADTDKCGCSP